MQCQHWDLGLYPGQRLQKIERMRNLVSSTSNRCVPVDHRVQSLYSPSAVLLSAGTSVMLPASVSSAHAASSASASASTQAWSEMNEHMRQMRRVSAVSQLID